MTQNLLETASDIDPSPSADETSGGESAPLGMRPEGVPEKFWDEANGQLRTEAMIKSYIELEKKLGSNGSPNIPESPESYKINIQNDVISIDPDLNKKLYEAGFTQDQAQLVYDLASDKLMPLVSEIAAVFEAEGQVARLVDHFGTEDRWREASRQISAWGKSHLPERVFDALSTTYEGVLAMHKMMAGDEPELAQQGFAAEPAATEADLKQLMRDPRYWRQQDPTIVRRVRDGFRRLYPESA